MRYLNWLLRIVLFVILLGFAVKNDEPVVLRYFFGYKWEASLVLVLLLFFSAGVAIGLSAALSKIFMQRREINKLTRELAQKNNAGSASDS